MIKWFIKFYIVMLRIASVMFLLGMPYLTISQYSDPWTGSISTREAYSESHVIVVFGGSWTSDKGYSRQTLLLIPKVWTPPKAIEISTEPKSIATHSGYLMLLIGVGIVALGIHTIVRLLRRLLLPKDNRGGGTVSVS